MKVALSRSLTRNFVGCGIVLASCVVLWGCGGGDGGGGEQAIPLTVPKAACGPNDHPETALQGQVPAALRVPGGFQGFSCNLQLVGQSRGDGASWQHASFKDGAGHQCAYHDTASSTANRTHLGVVTVDLTNSSVPTPTTYLTSVGMLDPWESLKVNPNRQLLGATQATNGRGGPVLDLYDLSGDCRNPQLLASVAIGSTQNGDAGALPQGGSLAGHEGAFAPDGLTYYGGDRGTPIKYSAIDITNTTHPKLITTYTVPTAGTVAPASVISHGLSISADGNRAYFTLDGDPGAGANLATFPPNNGIQIVDVSEIQARKDNPQVREISRLLWSDGSHAQHTIPVTIGGKAYLVAVDEGGPGGTSTSGTNGQKSCDAGLAPFPMARIIDISDEKNPTTASKLMLEIHNPKNCDKVLPDIVGLSSFTYGAHYCSVDNRVNATTLACGYFESGIRVFDIRDPLRPKEIAYYNPPAVTTPSPGSQNNQTAATGRPDHCSAQVRLDVATASLWTTCQDNGLLVLRFTNGVWPFPESTAGLQN